MQLEPEDAHYRGLLALRLRVKERRGAISRHRFGDCPSDGLDRDRIRAAADLYASALRSNTRDAMFAHNLAVLNVLLGRYRQAASLLDAAAGEAQDDPLPLITRKVLFERFHDTQAAAISYARAVAISPEIVGSEFFEDLALRAGDNGKPVILGGIRQIEAEIAVTRSPVAEAKLGSLLVSLHRYDAGGRALGGAVAALPNLPEHGSTSERYAGGRLKPSPAKPIIGRALFWILKIRLLGRP